MQEYQSSISINSLFCAVDSKVILSDINFNLISGQSVTITGPNGVGKTLLLNTIVGFKSILGLDTAKHPSDADWKAPRAFAFNFDSTLFSMITDLGSSTQAH